MRSADVQFVTAFYPGPSKHPSALYALWAAELFMHCGYRITCFVPDKDAARRVAAWSQHRETVRIRILPADRLPALAFVDDWEAQFALDPEQGIHRSSHLYKVWNSKPFLAQEVAADASDAGLVFWIDIGYVRHARTGVSLQHLDSARLRGVLGDARMYLLSLRDFSRGERGRSTVISPDEFLRSIRLGSGMFGGTGRSWDRWTPSYGDALRSFARSGCFVGKDQNVVAALVLRDPSNVRVWRARRFGGDPWFSFPRAVGKHEIRL